MRSIVPHSIHSLKEKNILLLTCVSLLIVILFGGRIVGDWDGEFDTWHENHETARTINYGQEFVENPFQKCVDPDYLGDKWMMDHSFGRCWYYKSIQPTHAFLPILGHISGLSDEHQAVIIGHFFMMIAAIGLSFTARYVTKMDEASIVGLMWFVMPSVGLSGSMYIHQHIMVGANVWFIYFFIRFIESGEKKSRNTALIIGLLSSWYIFPILVTIGVLGFLTGHHNARRRDFIPLVVFPFATLFTHTLAVTHYFHTQGGNLIINSGNRWFNPGAVLELQHHRTVWNLMTPFYGEVMVIIIYVAMIVAICSIIAIPFIWYRSAHQPEFIQRYMPHIALLIGFCTHIPSFFFFTNSYSTLQYMMLPIIGVAMLTPLVVHRQNKSHFTIPFALIFWSIILVSASDTTMEDHGSTIQSWMPEWNEWSEEVCEDGETVVFHRAVVSEAFGMEGKLRCEYHVFTDYITDEQLIQMMDEEEADVMVVPWHIERERNFTTTLKEMDYDVTSFQRYKSGYVSWIVYEKSVS